MIRYLYHVSDIHIRLYHRLDEYQVVFENLFSFLENEKAQGKKGLIVLTGDLLHHKNELSPECIVFTRTFMTRLSSIFKTILIAGNHDALLNNQHRMDSLSAVLKPLPPNLEYYKDSGFYQVENVVFGISSLLDKTLLKMDPKQRTTNQDKIFVALFHGGVGRYSTNKGFWMEGIPLSTFTGYDLVLLGDIHMYQYLDKEKRVAYAGSLISQNFTETNPHHGVLVWDLTDFSSTLVPIENPYAFCEARLEYPIATWQNKRYSLQELITCLPTKGRLNLYFSRKKTGDDIQWVNELKQRCPSLTIQEKIWVEEQQQTTHNKPKETWALDLIQSYIETLPKSWKDKDFLHQTLKSTWIEKGKGMLRWEILSVEFSNMFGYGEDNKIDFKQLPKHETIGIFGENSAGKSTLIEIIIFLLYGNITRYAHGASVPKEVIRFGQTKSVGRITFSVHGIVYQIEKKMSLLKSGKIKVDEKLWKVLENGKLEDLSEEHRKKTDKFVIQQIGTCEQFLFTTVFLQQNERSFRSMSPKDRKEFLFDMMDLQKFETLMIQKTEEWKQKKKLLDSIEKQQKAQPTLSSLENEIEQHKFQITQLSNQSDYFDNENKNLEQQLDDLYDQKKPVRSNTKTRLTQIEREMNDLEKELSSLFLTQDTSTLLEEIKTLLDKKVYIPKCPDLSVLHGFDKNNQESFEEWKKEHGHLFETDQHHLPIHELFRQKEDLTKKLIGEPSCHKYHKLTTKKCKSLLESQKIDVGVLEKKETSLTNELEQWTTQKEELDKTWKDKKKLLELEKAKRDQTSCMIGKLNFSDTCSYCLSNKQSVSSILEKEKIIKDLEWVVKTLEQQREQLEETIMEKKTNLEKVQEEIEDILLLQTVVYNRSIQKKILGVEAQIQQNQEWESKKNIYQTWTIYLDIKKALDQNQRIEKILFEKQTLLEKLKQGNEKRDRLENLKKEKVDYMSFLENESFNKEIYDAINKKKTILDENRKTQQKLLIQRATMEEKVKALLQSMEKSKKTWEDYNSLQKDVECLQHLTYVMGRDGFPMYVLEMYIPKMEEQLNELLSSFLGDRKVRLKLERKKESVNINLCICRKESDTIYLGGMEGFMVDAALKIVFARMSCIRTEMFIIDEGISALDKKNMENLDQLFQFLETFFSQVFIISHIKQVQDFVRHSIWVKKEHGKSQIVF